MRFYSVAILVAAVLLANVEQTTSLELIPADYPTEIRSVADNENGVARKRLLRRYDVDSEERAIGGAAISGLATKFKSSTSKLTEKLAKFSKYDDELAKKMEMDLILINDMLTSKNLGKLTAAVKKTNTANLFKKASEIGTLTARYGDDKLSTTLVTVQKKALEEGDTVLVRQVQKLRKDQLQRWMDGGNSVDDVFKRLNVRDDSHKFQVLDDYVKLVSPTNSDKTLFNTLMTGFGKREDKIGALLYAAKKNPDTAVKAQKYEASMVSKWANEGQLPANVFQWLKLYDDVDIAFSAENLNKMTKYVNEFNAKNTANTKSLLDIYSNAFKETTVTKKLIRATKVPATKDAATKLQKQQLEAWINNGNVAKLEEFATLNRGDLIKVLSRKFGNDLKLTKVLEKASKEAETTPLQKLLFARWAKKDITPENVLLRVFKKVSGTAITDEEKKIVDKFTKIYPSLKSGATSP